MIPKRHSTIIRISCMELMLAAGINWIALDVSTPDASATNTGNTAAAVDGSGSPVSNEDIAALQQFVDGN
jgi:hypothetical protein